MSGMSTTTMAAMGNAKACFLPKYLTKMMDMIRPGTSAELVMRMAFRSAG
jgi:hypothetical protein